MLVNYFLSNEASNRLKLKIIKERKIVFILVSKNVLTNENNVVRFIAKLVD